MATFVGGHAAGGDHRELAVLEELVERRGAGVHAEARPSERAERQRGARSGDRNAQVGPRLLVELAVVRRAAGRDDQVQAVLAAAQKEHDEDLVVPSAVATPGTALGESEGVEARSGETGDGGGAADQKAAARGLTHLEVSLLLPVQRQRNSGDMNISPMRVRKRSWV